MVNEASIVSEYCAEIVFPAESVTLTLKFDVTADEVEFVDVPEIVPPAERLRPAGSVDPDTADQLQVEYVPEPPVAVKVVAG